MYPKVFSDFAAAAGNLRPGRACCRRRLFLRHEGRGRDLRRHREGQDAGGPLPQAIGETDDKGMVTVFFELNGQPRRIKVPDRAHGASATARPGARPSPATSACRRADAGRRLDAGRQAGQQGQGRRRAAVHRGDEDGNRAACRARRHDRRGAGQGRRPDRRQGPAVVYDITLGFTVLRADDGREIIIANGTMAQQTIIKLVSEPKKGA
jgi:hypothetical protein